MEIKFEHEGTKYVATSNDGEHVTAKAADGSRLELAEPKMLSATVDDIYNIASINGLLCYIFCTEGRLSVKPALRELAEIAKVKEEELHDLPD